MMPNDYISREAAEKILYDGCHTTDGEETLDDVVEMWHMVQAIPAADVVEVVRCGECLHRTNGWPQCKGRPKDWFCAAGWRKPY